MILENKPKMGGNAAGLIIVPNMWISDSQTKFLTIYEEDKNIVTKERCHANLLEGHNLLL